MHFRLHSIIKRPYERASASEAAALLSTEIMLDGRTTLGIHKKSKVISDAQIVFSAIAIKQLQYYYVLEKHQVKL